MLLHLYTEFKNWNKGWTLVTQSFLSEITPELFLWVSPSQASWWGTGGHCGPVPVSTCCLICMSSHHPEQLVPVLEIGTTGHLKERMTQQLILRTRREQWKMYNAVYSLTDIRKAEINPAKSSFTWDFKNQTTVLFPVLSTQRTLKSTVITYGRTFFHGMI